MHLLSIQIVSLNAEYLVVVTIAMPLKDVLNDTLKLYRYLLCVVYSIYIALL